ncbi:MAG: cytochrome c oxidase subunit 3 [Luteolibacter sp.]
MEIPYIVTPRKDTGLFNSKIAIWLFLASEVMLFGGFFSAYVFLRLGADYPWPERTLPVLPGLINTFILIASSVTVVFAWAALKMREWRKFQLFMGITIACAAVFMVLKAVEYNVKLQHQGLRLNDYSIVEGHLDYKRDEDGRKIHEKNVIRIETETVTFSTLRHHRPWVRDILAQAAEQRATLTLASDIILKQSRGGSPEKVAAAGDALTLDLLTKLGSIHESARKNNSTIRTRNLRGQWAEAKSENPDKRGWQISSSVNIDRDAIAADLLDEISTVAFKVTPAAVLNFNPRDIQEGETSSRLRDDTVVSGKLLDSPMVFENVDAIDFQHLVMRAEHRGIDPIAAIEASWLYQNHAWVRETWAWHQTKVAALEQRLIDDYGRDENGNPNRFPTAKERYRIGWHDLADKAVEEGRVELSAIDKVKEEFMGPNYSARGKETFPELTVPRENIHFASKFTPAWNTYYAIYFAITAIHGLHVIGGAIVLGYYLFFGRKMYLSNPEWLANRVEVGGLFWHFVDLVWIFAFPIFYLM